ncbi:shematrin-like protein 2 [Haliotis cracherodii]|uniref:shematrin-like protein 2 n=1 Tax=Haliotis cracherodii TaxID=6455 RepID=UPI0039ED9977
MMKVIALVACLAVAAFAEPIGYGLHGGIGKGGLYGGLGMGGLYGGYGMGGSTAQQQRLIPSRFLEMGKIMKALHIKHSHVKGKNGGKVDGSRIVRKPSKMMKVIALVACLAVAAFAEPIGYGLHGGIGKGGLYGGLGMGGLYGGYGMGGLYGGYGMGGLYGGYGMGGLYGGYGMGGLYGGYGMGGLYGGIGGFGKGSTAQQQRLIPSRFLEMGKIMKALHIKHSHVKGKNGGKVDGSRIVRKPSKMMKVIALVACLAVAAFAEPIGYGLHGGIGKGGLYGGLGMGGLYGGYGMGGLYGGYGMGGLYGGYGMGGLYGGYGMGGLYGGYGMGGLYGGIGGFGKGIGYY